MDIYGKNGRWFVIPRQRSARNELLAPFAEGADGTLFGRRVRRAYHNADYGVELDCNLEEACVIGGCLELIADLVRSERH